MLEICHLAVWKERYEANCVVSNDTPLHFDLLYGKVNLHSFVIARIELTEPENLLGDPNPFCEQLLPNCLDTVGDG